jgi:hypothetical protein
MSLDNIVLLLSGSSRHKSQSYTLAQSVSFKLGFMMANCQLGDFGIRKRYNCTTPLKIYFILDWIGRGNLDNKLFADDCLLYRRIRTKEDQTIPQRDLDNLQQWENNCLMRFNPTHVRCS